ncbi:MAG: GNAT family N-acetyltransferase [Bacteroidetes bacterium]|nr:GNAT family N-acetyltransferase [Bacteroidota bacterium]
MHILIETPRLYIRELLPEDEKGMFEMDSDPEVHRYLGGKYSTSIDQERAYINNVRQQYIDNGIGRWAMIEKSTNEFVGWTGFKLLHGPINNHSNFHDFGYRLARRFWGQGYASEAAYASLHYGIANFGFKKIYAMTDVDNVVSRKLLEKLGFKFIEIFEYNTQPYWRNPNEPTTWYEYDVKRINNK